MSKPTMSVLMSADVSSLDSASSLDDEQLVRRTADKQATQANVSNISNFFFMNTSLHGVPIRFAIYEYVPLNVLPSWRFSTLPH